MNTFYYQVGDDKRVAAANHDEAAMQFAELSQSKLFGDSPIIVDLRLVTLISSESSDLFIYTYCFAYPKKGRVHECGSVQTLAFQTPKKGRKRPKLK